MRDEHLQNQSHALVGHQWREAEHFCCSNNVDCADGRFHGVGPVDAEAGRVLIVPTFELSKELFRVSLVLRKQISASKQYEVLKPVTSPREALEPSAPLIHPKRGTNLLSKSKLKRGDVEEAFHNSAHIIEDSYKTQRIEHLFLEPESCIAIPVDDASLSFDELR